MGVAVGSAVGVFVGVAVGIAVAVGVGVAEGIGVNVGAFVAVGMGVVAGVRASVGIAVGVAGTETAAPVSSTATPVGPSSFIAPRPHPATTNIVTAAIAARRARVRVSLRDLGQTRRGIGQCGTT